MQSLSSEERQILTEVNCISTEKLNRETSEITESPVADLTEPQEVVDYRELKSKSHFNSLKDRLKFLFQPDLRLNYELYIARQAVDYNLLALVPANWQQVPDIAVANLYWYFQTK